jgi:hypothetical protein
MERSHFEVFSMVILVLLKTPLHLDSTKVTIPYHKREEAIDDVFL